MFMGCLQGNYGNGFVYTIVLLITFWILFSYLVPISLFVTLEIVKFWQAFLYINNDREMKVTNSLLWACGTRYLSRNGLALLLSMLASAMASGQLEILPWPPLASNGDAWTGTALLGSCLSWPTAVGGRLCLLM